VSVTLTWPQWLLFLAPLYPVRLPAARKALRALKAQVENHEQSSAR
jgi:hypothetical protein